MPFQTPTASSVRYDKHEFVADNDDVAGPAPAQSTLLYTLDPEVKVIQRWNGYRPDYRLLIGSFYADLVGRHHHHDRQRTGTSTSISANNNINHNNNSTIPWIEKLLQTSIEDYRKHARDLILVPYLVVIKGITDEYQIYDIVMQWANKCAELKRLEPSRQEFAARIRSRIYQVRQNRVPAYGT